MMKSNFLKAYFRKSPSGDEGGRQELPDLLRGFAILLVVLGHCIQEGSGVEYSASALYFEDKLYQLIYSFHMPLFMMISGFLSWGSVRRAEKAGRMNQLLCRRAKTLLSPIFIWSALDYGLNLLLTPSLLPDSLWNFIWTYINRTFYALWFLWAVFWSFLIVFLVRRFCKNSPWIYGAIFLLMFVTPDGLGLGAYKYLFLYFVTAFYGRGLLESHGAGTNPWHIVIFGLGFAFLFLFFRADSMIYLTGYKLLGKNIPKQMFLDLYRALIGFVGSAFFILTGDYLLKNTFFRGRFLQILGRDTMGIYILSGYLILYVLRPLSPLEAPFYPFNILQAAVVLLVSWLGTRLLGRVPFLRILVGK